MRPLSLIRPSAWPAEAGPAAADSVRREPAAVVPIGEFGCGVPCAGPVRYGKWSPWSGGGERVVAEFGQDVAGLPDDLAGLGQGGPLAAADALDGGALGV